MRLKLFICDLIMFFISCFVLRSKKYEAQDKVNAYNWLRGYYIRKAIKQTQKATKYEVEKWELCNSFYNNPTCKNNAKESKRLYEKVLKGEFGRDYALRFVFSDKNNKEA